MIGYHCGKPVVTICDRATFFGRRCVVCNKKFYQRKRASKKSILPTAKLDAYRMMIRENEKAALRQIADQRFAHAVEVAKRELDKAMKEIDERVIE